MHLPSRPRCASRYLLAAVLAAVLAPATAGCASDPDATPAITPGTAEHPRAVIVVAKDYSYIPPVVDLVAGERVVLQIINGGLIVHEVVIGGLGVQDAWELAEAATVGAPPGPTPVVSVPPDLAGLRVVVQSGQRVDVPWTVPLTAPAESGGWVVGCHIPGHWAEGMVVPVRFVGPDGVPLPPPYQSTG